MSIRLTEEVKQAIHNLDKALEDVTKVLSPDSLFTTEDVDTRDELVAWVTLALMTDAIKPIRAMERNAHMTHEDVDEMCEECGVTVDGALRNTRTNLMMSMVESMTDDLMKSLGGGKRRVSKHCSDTSKTAKVFGVSHRVFNHTPTGTNN